MKPGFTERVREARCLASDTVALIWTGWGKNGNSISWGLDNFRKFWSGLESLFPGMGRARRFCWGVARKYYHDDCFSYASSLSFWLLISLVPMATLFVKVVVILLGNPTLHQQILDTLGKVIPYVPESFLTDAMNRSREISNSMGFTWLVLLFGGYWGVRHLDTSLAHVFGVRINKKLQTKKNNIIRQSALMVGGFAVMSVGFALLVGGALWKYLPVRRAILLENLPILICLLSSTLVFLVMTRVHVTFRQALAGALVTTVLWTLAKWGFRIYVDNALTWGIMYGPLLGIIAGLVFLYYSCAIMLLGAQVTAALYRRNKRAAEAEAKARG